MIDITQPSRETPELNVPPKEGQNIETQAYQQFMGDRAMKEGREGQDRTIDPDRALNADSEAFMSLLEITNDTNALQTLLDASPTAANLDPVQQKAYKETVTGLAVEKVNTLEMDAGRDGSISGISTAEIVRGIGNPGIDRTTPTTREERLFDAERTELMARPSPGTPLSAKHEYQRELGALLKEFGRDGLAFKEEECDEVGRTVDQFISARMTIGGYQQNEVLEAVAFSSPETADLPTNQVLDYLIDDIQPVFSDPEVVGNTKEVEAMRSEYKIPDDIKRSDCLERVLQAIPEQKWNPQKPELTCPVDPSFSPPPPRPPEPEPEPLLEP